MRYGDDFIDEKENAIDRMDKIISALEDVRYYMSPDGMYDYLATQIEQTPHNTRQMKCRKCSAYFEIRLIDIGGKCPKCNEWHRNRHFGGQAWAVADVILAAERWLKGETK